MWQPAPTQLVNDKPPIGAPMFGEPVIDPVIDEKAKKKAAHEEKEKQRLALNDAKAVGMGTYLMTLSMNMGGENSKAFIQKLDEIDDPDLRKKVLTQFEKLTGQSMTSFIEGCSDWNNNGDKRDKHAALQLIDDKRGKAEEAIAKMDPALRAIKEKEANDRAIQILSATTAHDHSDENMQKIFRALGPADAVEIEMIRAAVRKHTDGQSNLYQAIDNGTKKGDEDQAIAMLAGDRVGSARAALANETDPKRLREVITALKPKELEELRTGPFKEIALARIENPADRAEMRALIEGNRAQADAEHLANLLLPRNAGNKIGDKVGKENHDRRKASNVMKEFEGMSGEDVKAAAEAWNKAHPFQTFEMMITARWGEDDDPAELKRLLAMVKGDKGLARSIRLEAGMRDEDQEEIEAALAHQKVDEKDLTSNDPEVRKKAEAIKRENESFETNNRASDQLARRAQMILAGKGLEAHTVVGRATKQ